MKSVKRFLYSLKTRTFIVEWHISGEEQVSFSKFLDLCRKNPEAPVYCLVLDGDM